MKGRQMPDHALYATMGWEARSEQIMVVVDFQKAYALFLFPS